jgi:hypothetical protein
MHPVWARKLRDDCAASGTPYFFKQWGRWLPFVDIGEDRIFQGPVNSEDFHSLPGAVQLGRDGHRIYGALPVGKAKSGDLLDGRQHKEFPTVNK